jgi:lysyl-tRNA synthetase class 2
MISFTRLQQRAAIIAAVRRFFEDRSFLEVQTPVRLPVLAPETWIEPERSGDHFLQTSPELCMKRLLAGGHAAIFQICPCFRRGERGRLHLPEFLMLEWYRRDQDYLALMADCEELLWEVADYCGLQELRGRDGQELCLDPPWERLTVAEAFARFGGMSPEAALAEGIYEEVLVERVEPNLGRQRPCFLHDYPAGLASLARLQPGNPAVAERFELYLAGIELANGFSELTDAVEQRHRFEQERRNLDLNGRDPGPMPESYLRELAGLPAAAGIALGLDRLVMLLSGAASLDEVVCFVPEELS